MPTYEFICSICGMIVEQFFKIDQVPKVNCANCSAPMIKGFSPTAAIFKGDGWGKDN